MVGDHNVVNRYEGTVVQFLPAGTAPAREARSRPQLRLPHAGPPVLGRDLELEVARRAIAKNMPVEFYGPAGIGKTAVLNDLAHKPGSSWKDGIVHARVGGQSLEDVLQWLFEVFWKTEPAWAPGPLRVREYLRELRALVILDDVEFSVEEVAGLVDASGHPTFLLASKEPHFDPTPSSAPLRGLPVGAAVATFERVLNRPLDDAERPAVTELVERLACVPALVVEAARLIRDGVCTLSDLAVNPEAVLERRRILPLTEAQRRLLALLVELAPAPVPVTLLETAARASAGDAEALEQAGFAETNSPRYSLARPVSDVEQAELPVLQCEPFLKRLTEAAQSGSIGEDGGAAAVAALEWGRRAGALDAVVDAARAVDGALVRARRTGAWGAAIACGAEAARECGRAADEAYFLHQQGTRWLCLGERDRAEEALRRALGLREHLADEPGAAATWHNLGVLESYRRGQAVAITAVPKPRSAWSWISSRWTRWGLNAIAVATGVFVGVVVGAAGTGSLKSGGKPVQTVTQPGKTVTEAGKTVTEAGSTFTHTAAISTVTETASTATVTGPTTTVTTKVEGPTVTTTTTITVTVTTTPPPPG